MPRQFTPGARLLTAVPILECCVDAQVIGLTILGLLGGGNTPAAPVPHAPALRPVAARLITHGDRQRRQVALTFDACQTRKPSGFDARLIHILRATHTPATLMLGGYWMETHPAVTRSLAADPLFELGNHSYLHPHMANLTPARMRAELQETQDVMYRLTGRQGTMFRPPYGEYSPALLSVAGELGLHTFTWEVVTGDPDPHVTAQDIERAVAQRTGPAPSSSCT